MRVPLKPSVVLAFLLAAGWIGTPGSDRAAADRSFTFRADTPPVEMSPLAPDDPFVDIRIEGFHARSSESGAPDIPTRIVLVAIPPGATPRLSVRPVGELKQRAQRPRPAPRVLQGVSSFDRSDRGGVRPAGPLVSRKFYQAADEYYRGDAVFPKQIAWLGRTGVLRDQRYVEVHLAPVRFDSKLGAVMINPALEVTLHFDGDFGAVTTPQGSDRYESVYRNNFVNYAQGRQFRLGALAPDGRASLPPRETSGSLPGGPLYRILIDKNGPVRLDYNLIAAAAPEFLDHDPVNWRLGNRGEQVPLQIHEGPGDPTVFESDEWVQFYGQALDDEPQTVLSLDLPGEEDDLYEARDFTDVNTYFLSVDTDPQPLMTEREALPPGGLPEPDFLAVARKEVDDKFLPHDEELWFWDPFTIGGGSARTEILALPGLVSGTLPAQFRVRLRGFTDCLEFEPDHETNVTVRNDLLQTLGQNMGSFNGNNVFEHDFGWTHSGADPQLTDPVRITLQAPALTCPTDNGDNYGFAYFNDVLLDSIEVDYRSIFHTTNDHFTFRYPDGDFKFEITGFSGNAIEVYEITDQIGSSGVVDTVRLTDASVVQDQLTYTVGFRTDDTGGSMRRFIVAENGSIPVLAAEDLLADRVSTLRSDTTTHADMVVIVHPDLIESECSEGNNPCSYDVDCTLSPTDMCEMLPGTPLGQLLALRASQNIDSRVVRIQDVEDEFNDGLPGPLAIQQFLAWVHAGGWAGDPPAYVMLVGDGSYDYKAGTLAGNFVPTQIVIKESLFLEYFSTDNGMTAVAGADYTPDLVAARISTRTLVETNGVVQKILDAEQMMPAGAWRSSLLFISDRDHSLSVPGLADVFVTVNNVGIESEFLVDTPYTTEHLNYWYDYCPQDGNPCDEAGMTQDIKDNVNGILGEGVAIAQFAGHGNDILWSDDGFFCTDDSSPFCIPPPPAPGVPVDYTQDLHNDLKLPFLVVHNCLSNAFHNPDGKSLGEQWLKRIPDGQQPDGGGAFAVWAPSGLGFPTHGLQLTKIMFEDVFGPRKERQIAVPVLDGLVHLCTSGGNFAVEPCQYYTLLGDPSSSLALPHVGPASNVVATASTGVDAFVQLSWDPSSTSGATYDIYRRDVFSTQNYIKIMDSTTETSFLDQTVNHTKLYYYYLIAEDQGFESAWSNFNSDCGEPPGDDCVQATPINTFPPTVPSGLTITDAETGGRLDLTWSHNPEADIFSYTIHYGPTTGYGLTKTVIFFSHTILTGLMNGQPYFFAIEATNTSGLTGALSDPAVSGTPTLVLGVKAPAFISDLRLSKSGPDAVLSWGPVTQDIYGKPLTVDLYEVYRGNSPQFDPLDSAPIGTPSGTTFTDPDALAPGGPDYHYLVRAVDLSGNPGGLGRQLPAGILDLVLEPAGPSLLRLLWSEITLDFDNNQTQVSHYELYADDEAFTRADIQAGLVTPIATDVPGESIEIPLPAGPNRYYSVLAVDVRGNRSPF